MSDSCLIVSKCVHSSTMVNVACWQVCVQQQLLSGGITQASIVAPDSWSVQLFRSIDSNSAHGLPTDNPTAFKMGIKTSAFALFLSLLFCVYIFLGAGVLSMLYVSLLIHNLLSKEAPTTIKPQAKKTLLTRRFTPLTSTPSAVHSVSSTSKISTFWAAHTYGPRRTSPRVPRRTTWSQWSLPSRFVQRLLLESRFVPMWWRPCTPTVRTDLFHFCVQLFAFSCATVCIFTSRASSTHGAMISCGVAVGNGTCCWWLGLRCFLTAIPHLLHHPSFFPSSLVVFLVPHRFPCPSSLSLSLFAFLVPHRFPCPSSLSLSLFAFLVPRRCPSFRHL